MTAGPYGPTVQKMGAGACEGTRRARRAGSRLRLRPRDESGNIMVMFGLLLPVFILVCAIVIDVSYWWVNAKKAQVAADACALAAAGQADFPQPYNLDHCRFGSPEKDYVRTNLHLQVDPTQSIWHKSTAVIAPYKGDPKRVEATVDLRVNTFFGTFVGLDYVDITRRAVAEKLEDDGNWAIYSHDFTGCDAGEGLEFDGGAGISINGRIHSNARYHVNSGNPESGDQFWALEGTIDRNTCVATLNPAPQGAAYGTGPEPRDWLPQDGTFEPWPAWYTPSQFNWPQCSGANFSARQINIKNDKIELKDKTFGGGDQDIPVSGGNIPAGTYCAREQLTTSGTGLKGNVTLLSPQISISGTGLDFSPHAHNVLLFSVPNWGSNWAADTNPSNDGTFPSGEPITCTNRNIETNINAGTIKWAGTIFNPCGRVAVNSGSAIGGNPALVGTILGYKVKINQNDFNMIGLDDFGGNFNLALWE